MTLTRRLLLVALISVLPAIVIWTYTEVSLRRAREAEVRGLALRQAQLASSELDRIFEGIRNLLVAVEEVPAVRTFDNPSCMTYLGNLQAKVPYLDAIMVLDPNGQTRCQQGAWPVRQIKETGYFQEALETGEFVIGEYSTSPDGKAENPHPVLPLVRAFRDESSRIAGVVVATLDLDWLGQ